MHWVFLGSAIVFEVIATMALKASMQFTRPGPTALMAAGYATSFYLLSLTLKVIPVGVVYALWSGIGICLIAAAGWVLFGQRLDGPAVLGIAMIVAGIVVIQMFSGTARH